MGRGGTNNWDTAGVIAGRINRSVGRLGDTQRLCVLNLPDNNHGAYSYRNGFPEALDLFVPARVAVDDYSPPVKVLCYSRGHRGKNFVDNSDGGSIIGVFLSLCACRRIPYETCASRLFVCGGTLHLLRVRDGAPDG